MYVIRVIIGIGRSRTLLSSTVRFLSLTQYLSIPSSLCHNSSTSPSLTGHTLSPAQSATTSHPSPLFRSPFLSILSPSSSVDVRRTQAPCEPSPRRCACSAKKRARARTKGHRVHTSLHATRTYSRSERSRFLHTSLNGAPWCYEFSWPSLGRILFNKLIVNTCGLMFVVQYLGVMFVVI